MKKIVLRILIYLTIVVSFLFYLYSPLGERFHSLHRLSYLEYTRRSMIIYLFIAALAGGALIYLVRIKAWMRIAFLIGVTLLFAVYPPLSSLTCQLRTPSPLCTIYKPLLFASHGAPALPVKFLVTFTVIVLLTVTGSKLFCGWICPVGALQEVVFIISPLKKRIVPFAMSNSMRSVIFVLSLILLFSFSFLLVFEYLNPFVFFQFKPYLGSLWYTSLGILMVSLIASLLYFRPYCHWICPVGFITWLLEPLALFKVKYNPNACTECMDCITETGCVTVDHIMKEKKIPGDCFSCGSCIEKCPSGALSYGITPLKRK